jgi:site-specific DNA-methyltransferase (cytosine-N4-specific)
MIIKADSRYIPLKDKSVNCIVTSPPYWSLRKYDIPDLVWDGEKGCEHEWVEERAYRDSPTREKASQCFSDESTPKNQRWKINDRCSKCNAWRGQLGLEPTIDLYLKHLLQIMDECKRVLRNDGTMWVNLGDSYGGSHSGEIEDNKATQKGTGVTKLGFDRPSVNIFPKSLCLIPYRFAIEMVDRGWILRNILIWHKPNCMPSSVKDRFTVDFEPVFFFVKSRKYWFEQQYEDFFGKNERQWAGHYDECGSIIQGDTNAGIKRTKRYPQTSGRNRRCVWTVPNEPEYIFGELAKKINDFKDAHPEIDTGWFDDLVREIYGDNYKHSVWTVPTQPYPESHFATFSEALIEPMIRAGCPKGGIVLDPFCGSGTTIKMAERLNRVGIGIDLGYQNLSTKKMRLIQKELLV